MTDKQQDIFSIDVSAEAQKFAAALSPKAIKESQIQQIDNKPQLPTSVIFGPSKTLENLPNVVIPSSLTAQPMPNTSLLSGLQTMVMPNPSILKPLDGSPLHSTSADKSHVAVDMHVKFNAEKSFHHIKHTVSGMQDAIDTLMGEAHSKKLKIPITSKASSFEEKAMLEMTNGVFENRKVKFSETPVWA